MSDAFLPPTGRQAWFQDGDDQVNLVGFYNVVSILTVVYISLAYFGSNSFLGIYSLFYYRHEFVGDATDIPFDTIESANGFVPEFSVPGLHHTVLACAAPEENEDNGSGGGEPGGGGRLGFVRRSYGLLTVDM